MNNETKRDVFDELLEIAGNAMDQAMSAQYPSDENGCAPGSIGKAIRDILDPIEKRYDAASSCKLPVIPKVVGDTIEEFKANHYKLSELFNEWDLNYDEQELIACAWLDGYQVEEAD